MNDISPKRQSQSLREWISSLKEFQLDNFFDIKSLGRAYDYINKLDNISIEHDKITASIHGSTIYQVQLSDHGTVIKGDCTCPLDSSCKHMAALLLSQMEIKF